VAKEMTKEDRLFYIRNKQEYIAFYMTLPANIYPKPNTILNKFKDWISEHKQ
jgi:hypothetical protein